MELIDGITRTEINFMALPRCKPQEAILWLQEECNKIDPQSPLYYNTIRISPEVTLEIPGKHGKEHPGDYRMLWNGKAPSHEDVIVALICTLDENNVDRPNMDYSTWIKLLEDIYENGTLNLDDYKDERIKRIMVIVFWLTLQEDINLKMGGRVVVFRRYAEALATTQQGFEHTVEEVVYRLRSHRCPDVLEMWDLPTSPNYYKLSAF